MATYKQISILVGKRVRIVYPPSGSLPNGMSREVIVSSVGPPRVPEISEHQGYIVDTTSQLYAIWPSTIVTLLD